MRIMLECTHCPPPHPCTRPITTSDELVQLIGNYLAHLVESHWDILSAAHAARFAPGMPPVNDAWTRI